MPRNKTLRILTCALIFNFQFSIFNSSAQGTDSCRLHLDGSLFFINNEYFGDRVSGYTLPGFVLQPKAECRLGEKVALKGGLHWLHHWGVRDYPATASYGVYPPYDSVSRPMHILPWLQAKIMFRPNIKLTLGNLDNDGHDLPLPLYNPELSLVGDPEAGFELEAGNRWMLVEIWADWREFIWNRSPVPERFTAGLSGRLIHHLGSWAVYLPLNFVVQHEGGQNMSVSHNINNNFNAAAGLGLLQEFSLDSYLDFSCRVMWYHQHGNAAVPFSKGWGIYPEAGIGIDNWSLMASYWYGKDFVPLMGSWHFSNLSANTEGLTFDRTRVVTLKVGWDWSPSDGRCNFTLYGTLYHYLPSTGTFADGTTREEGHRNQIAFGCALTFNPTWMLR